VSHRTGKLGIGSAHQEGISYAYRNGYDLLITLDCDFTHDPAKIPDLLKALEGCDVVLGSRFLEENSLPGWSFYRRSMTQFGHFLTRTLLRIKYDATGAFRLYDLRKIPPGLFKAIRSKSYSFFFESLFVLSSNGFQIREIPVVLPSRTYGHSKLSLTEAFRGAMFLLGLSLERLANPGRFLVGREPDKLREDLHDPQDWAPYWRQKKEVSGFVYETVAALYRNLILRPVLRRTLFQIFKNGASLLHAGCGSGQVDVDLQNRFKLTAVDISRDALDLYARYNPNAFRIEQASILDLPYEKESYDGVYNLGVVEHFTEENIIKILDEFHRILRPDGKVVIFWPSRCAPSVFVLNSVHWIAKNLLKQELKLHPAEISLLASKVKAKSIFEAAKFELVSCRMSIRDGFIQAVLIGRKRL
jgi:dolichol-phosphate mannosyltransferase